MSAADRKQDDAGGDAGPAEALSRLEEALRRALASAPRDRVVKCIATALPAEVLIDENARLHGKVRKVSVSMPEELADAVRARTGTGGFSRYVTDAVQEQVRLDLLDDLAAEFEAEYGPIPEELVQEAMRQWPDYEDE
jgi:Arc/MetJ-type ribon-helix-helix transcriptional regulator